MVIRGVLRVVRPRTGRWPKLTRARHIATLVRCACLPACVSDCMHTLSAHQQQ